MRALAVAIVVLGSTAWAHESAKVVRNEASCTRLSGSDTSGDRGACTKCVRIAKHHFHPELSGDKRCHAVDAKP